MTRLARTTRRAAAKATSTSYLPAFSFVDAHARGTGTYGTASLVVFDPLGEEGEATTPSLPGRHSTAAGRPAPGSVIQWRPHTVPPQTPHHAGRLTQLTADALTPGLWTGLDSTRPREFDICSPDRRLAPATALRSTGRPPIRYHCARYCDLHFEKRGRSRSHHTLY